jgi:hypothetical protein
MGHFPKELVEKNLKHRSPGLPLYSIIVKNRVNHTKNILIALLAMLLCSAMLAAQTAPPSTSGIFPLSQIHAGQKATAWTVFRGNRPEPMDVEILGVLRGARGPGQDMILAQLHGAKPEYTGVVAGMSGSPVYIDGKLAGALSYRIGQFAKDPIAGVTPIEQMLAVRALPIAATDHPQSAANTQQDMQPMETPLVLSEFSPEAVAFWQKTMAGTGLETVAVGGSGSSLPAPQPDAVGSAPTIEPGAAVSAQLVRGDMEIAATCTVTYADPTQILACGHPILQAGEISLPMTETEVVLTLASPLNSYKIVNTGRTIGAFTEDRDAAIRGVLGARARMIPVQILIGGATDPKQLNVEVVDLPTLTPQAVEVVVLQSLMQSLRNTDMTSYHVTGQIALNNGEAAPVDVWAVPSDSMQAPISAVLQIGNEFQQIYANASRLTGIRTVKLRIDPVERRAQVELLSARLLGSEAVHAGETVEVEAVLRPWQQEERTERIRVQLPARLKPGTVRLLLSGATALDRTLEPGEQTQTLDALLAEERQKRPADRLYVSLLEPEAQAEVSGQELSNLPLSLKNTLEPLRASQHAALRGESVLVLTDHAVNGVLSGSATLNLRIEMGSGLD